MRVADSQFGDAKALRRQDAALRKCLLLGAYRRAVWEQMGRPDPIILPPDIARYAGSAEAVDAVDFLKYPAVSYFDEDGAAYELSETQGRPADVDTAADLLARKHLGLCLGNGCAQPRAESVDYWYVGDERSTNRPSSWCAKHRPRERKVRDQIHAITRRAARELLAARAGDLTPIR
jgi:hypothetical protein